MPWARVFGGSWPRLTVSACGVRLRWVLPQLQAGVCMWELPLRRPGRAGTKCSPVLGSMRSLRACSWSSVTAHSHPLSSPPGPPAPLFSLCAPRTPAALRSSRAAPQLAPDAAGIAPESVAQRSALGCVCTPCAGRPHPAGVWSPPRPAVSCRRRVAAPVQVNYYAPWCPWCQRLAPTWEAVMNYAHTQYPVTDGRIRVAKIDCTIETVRIPAPAGDCVPSN